MESKKNRESIFQVFSALITDELSQLSEKSIRVQGVEPGGTVLVVENQDMVREMAESMLMRPGYDVFAGSGGAEAAKLILENPDQVRFLVADLTMFAMDGWVTLAALRKIGPHNPVILVSGYDEACAEMKRLLP